MAFPTNWPPRAPSGRRSIRGYKTGTCTANFSDNAYMFIDMAAGSANTFTPLPKIGTGNTATDANSIGLVGTPITIPTTPQGAGNNDSGAPLAQIWAMGIRVSNDGASNIEISFDGTNVHGLIKAGTEVTYLYRHESGIALRGVGMAFRVEIW